MNAVGQRAGRIAEREIGAGPPGIAVQNGPFLEASALTDPIKHSEKEL
jgi:hypothetical protein